MGGSAQVRRAVVAVLIAVTALGCTATPPPTTREESDPDSTRVRTDTAPLQRPFAAIGELSDPHWLGYNLHYESRPLVPDQDPPIRVVGIAHLPAGTAAAITSRPEYAFHPVAPADGATPAAPTASSPGSASLDLLLPGPGQLPVPLRHALPVESDWLTSEAYDRTITGSRYQGRFFLDPLSDSVYFDTVSPTGPNDGNPS
ncbi:hypothetical protein ACGFZP_34110 [Kitasatospora sp. NPDC048239]|uniref:hypothetical protein n=1 Tax=Kitasatospora sp. NPDC048239 TaxID=3364046 RepID=UPI0037119B1B